MKTIWKIIKAIITIFLIIVLLLVVLQKITKNRLTIGNIYIFQIASASMLPEYNVGDVIVVKKVSPSKIKVGDDVTYIGTIDSFSDLTITHRIVDVRVDDGKYYFTTQGLSNNISDPEIKEDSVFGKVIYHTILFSFVGRLMNNVVIYYLLFIAVGVSFSYEVISSFLIKRVDDDDEEE